MFKKLNRKIDFDRQEINNGKFHAQFNLFKVKLEHASKEAELNETISSK